MITVVKLSPDEISNLKNKGETSYWSMLLGLVVIFFIFSLFIDNGFEIFLFCSLLVAGIFGSLYIFGGKSTTSKDLETGVKIIRIAKITDIQKTIAYKTRLKFIEMEVDEEPVPSPYPQKHRFVVYNSLGGMYYEQQSFLGLNLKELIGKEVAFSYFPYSGVLLSFSFKETM